MANGKIECSNATFAVKGQVNTSTLGRFGRFFLANESEWMRRRASSGPPRCGRRFSSAGRYWAAGVARPCSPSPKTGAVAAGTSHCWTTSCRARDFRPIARRARALQHGRDRLEGVAFEAIVHIEERFFPAMFWFSRKSKAAEAIMHLIRRQGAGVPLRWGWRGMVASVGGGGRSRCPSGLGRAIGGRWRGPRHRRGGSGWRRVGRGGGG